MAACKAAGFDLIVVETSGIGQGDAAIVPHVDVPLYVMTPEYGAASQLEKIDMLDFADFVAINKFDRKGAADALRDVAKQVQRNKEAFDAAAGRDAGVRHHGRALQRRRRDRAVPGAAAAAEGAGPEGRPSAGCRGVPRATARTRRRSCRRSACATWPRSPTPCAATSSARASRRALARERQQLRAARRHARRRVQADKRAPPKPRTTLADRPRRQAGRAQQEAARHVAADAAGLRRRRVRGEDPRQGDPHRAHPHLARPAARSARWRCRATRTTASCCKWLLLENVPGSFPYTAGVFAFKRENEDPTRMFAGEGDAVPHQPALQAAVRRHAGQAPVAPPSTA
ncbi:MAG: hypothetical protein MZW92_36730 [Comamonadaceae bacterium]|nr:hypothetical protein [Comamonadaceae bacterium]